MSTNPELWKKPGPKGQRASRVQSRDPSGRDKRMDTKPLAEALARFLPPVPKVST